jgi:hypothetical protein
MVELAINGSMFNESKENVAEEFIRRLIKNVYIHTFLNSMKPIIYKFDNDWYLLDSL